MCAPWKVVPATQNRDGRDITAAAANFVMQRQTNGGFKIFRFRSICALRPSNEDAWATIIKKSENAAMLDPGLPKVGLGKVNHVGFAGSTPNTGWRMVLQRRPMGCYISELVDGRHLPSTDKLAELDADQASTCRTCAPWIVLSAAIWTEAPEAFNIIQEAENLLQQVANLPGWIDGVLKGSAMVLIVDTDEATCRLHKQMPNLKETEVRSIVHFAEKMGGDDQSTVTCGRIWQTILYLASDDYHAPFSIPSWLFPFPSL
jgi:hypothetical protein